jgi:transposase InsO family protein
VVNTREGNVGGHTLSQDLGPLHRLQRCGGLDRQCDLEILLHSTQVVIKTSKVAHFIPTKDEAMAQEMGRLLFSHIFKHRGLPKDIVSDRNPKFTSKFWRALWKRMGSELKMSTSFRPQIDGQTERVNLVIQQFLRNYVAADQQDWVDHLELAEFCYNNSEHSATGSTPF